MFLLTVISIYYINEFTGLIKFGFFCVNLLLTSFKYKNQYVVAVGYADAGFWTIVVFKPKNFIH